MKLSIPVPGWLARLIFPKMVRNLEERAEIHGEARASRRTKGGIVELEAAMKKRKDRDA